MGFPRSRCIDSAAHTGPVLSLHNESVPDDVVELFHYTADIAQTDLPPHSHVCDGCVGTWSDAIELTGAPLQHGPTKRRALRVTHAALDQFFEELPFQSAVRWMREFKSKETVAADYLQDTPLPPP
jgi:hypothetical protein